MALALSSRHGRLTGERIRELISEWREASIWFCGPAGFGEALKRDLAAHGFPVAGRFHQELFTMRWVAGRVAMSHLQSIVMLAIASIALSGCSTLPNGRLWGGDATLAPGWERVRESAVEAASDPWVWGPLLGAAAFQIDDWDQRTSDWAREHTPIFGSQGSADQWSDDLRSASVLAQQITLAATPGSDDAGDWIIAKAKGFLVQAAATGLTTLVTNELKSSTDRERPNGLEENSFPSGHTSSSAVSTRLASDNLESIEMKRGTRMALDAGLTTLTVGTAWARIEAGWHFPSDTLVGMALGNFIASFVNDAFLGLDSANLAVAFVPTAGGAMLQWSWTY